MEKVSEKIFEKQKNYTAAAADSSIAKFNLARLKIKAGFQIPAQLAFKSVVLKLKKAAQHRDTSAMICLADCAYNGWGTKRSLRDMAKWYRLATKEVILWYTQLSYCYENEA